MAGNRSVVKDIYIYISYKVSWLFNSCSSYLVHPFNPSVWSLYLPSYLFSVSLSFSLSLPLAYASILASLLEREASDYYLHILILEMKNDYLSN